MNEILGRRRLTWESNNGAMLKFVLLQSLGVNAVLVDDASIPLRHSNARGSGTGEVATRVQANVTKSLDNVGLASPAWSVANHGHVLSLVDEVLQPVEDSPTSGTGPPMDTSLVDWLAWKVYSCESTVLELL